MSVPDFDPKMVLELLRIVLRWAAYFLIGSALVGLAVYIVFLCLEISALKSRSKAQIAKVPHCRFTTPRVKAVPQLNTPHMPAPDEPVSAAGEEELHKDLSPHRVPRKSVDH